jgi:crossover junction endodeoxyribonuclease RuvC
VETVVVPFSFLISRRLWFNWPVGITPKQFEQLQARQAAARRQPSPLLAGASPPRRDHEIVLGVDPSLRGTGYGVIRRARPHPQALAYGTVRCPAAWERSRCLVKIAETLRQVIRQHHPTVCVFEGLFYAQNLQTALIMGEARGAGLAAVAEAGLEIFELAPRRVKQAVVGYGGAQKLAVAKMVQRQLGLEKPLEPDAADALALALAHLQQQSRYSLTPARRI